MTKEDYKKALYHLAVYRLNKFEIDEDVIILESYTRIGLGEEQVALYLMNNLLKENDTNYEAYLIRAKALRALGKDGVKESLDRAVRYSAGTEDGEYIQETVKYLMDVR